MLVSLKYAERHLDQVLEAAYSGHEVTIASPDKPALRLVLEDPLAGLAQPAPISRKDMLGQWEGLMTAPSDEEWKQMDKEIEDLMVNGPLFPPESE